MERAGPAAVGAVRCSAVQSELASDFTVASAGVAVRAEDARKEVRTGLAVVSTARRLCWRW